MRCLAAPAALLIGLLMAGSANAALIVNTGNDNTDTDNVINNSCTGQIDGPGNTVRGCLNTDSNQGVTFTSTDTIRFAAGGQAAITGALNLATQPPNDTLPFGNLKVELDGETFIKLVLNIDAVSDGFVQFDDGTNTSAKFALSGNGNNFFTITGGPFSFIHFVTFDTAISAIEFDESDTVKQVRIGASPPPCPTCPDPGGDPIPEPGTLALMGVGMAAVGLAMRRRRRA